MEDVSATNLNGGLSTKSANKANPTVRVRIDSFEHCSLAVFALLLIILFIHTPFLQTWKALVFIFESTTSMATCFLLHACDFDKFGAAFLTTNIISLRVVGTCCNLAVTVNTLL